MAASPAAKVFAIKLTQRVRGVQGGVEPTYCMGDDNPLAVLSDQPHMLYTYFKQRFAQVLPGLCSHGHSASASALAAVPICDCHRFSCLRFQP